MRFGYVIIYVQDVAATLDFYERAFALERRFLDETGMYGELDTGGTALAFAAERMIDENGLDATPNTIDALPAAAEICFVVDDVAAACERAIAAGAVAAQPPQSKPWGQTVAHVRDNNGFLVELCSPMGEQGAS